jgi:hypothetical protein
LGCRAIDLLPLIASSYGESGICFDENNEEQIRDMLFDLNQALPMLMKRLDAKGTLSRWEVPVCGGIFGLPLDCLDVRQVFVNGCAVTLRDQWYEGQIGHKLSSCGLFCGSSDLIDMGDGYATPEPWPAQNQDARYGVMAEADSDAGKVVQIKGKDRYGNDVEEEIVLLAQQQVASSQSALTSLTFQHKGVTDGAVVGFVTYPARSSERILRLPSATRTASFHRKKLPLSFGCSDGVLSILGKLRFTPLVNKTDVMPICDEMALSFALQALTALRGRRLDDYNSSLLLAVNELSRELEDIHPAGVISQMSVKSPVRFRQRLWN